MTTKSQQLQIRVTPREKAALKRLAKAAGQDLSSFVLSRALPPAHVRFQHLVALLGREADHRYVLAELNDFLMALTPAEFSAAVSAADVRRLSAFRQNYLAAMVEQAAHMKGAAAPDWTTNVEPLAEPWFATSLESLRLHLLRSSPVPFKRRNLFVDSALGARV
jgi:uncharacterized protein (DUF1778 family)